MKNTVAIIGGGLAGIAAAIRLCESDRRPILIESRKRLGGRATSLADPRSGHTVDNCQHVLMGCCTNLIDLYDRLGVLECIEWHKTIYWTRGGPDAPIGELHAGWLPAPFHLAGSFRRMPVFGKSDKKQIARGMWRLIRLGPRGRLNWTNRTFAEFLRQCDQSPGVIRDFWNAVVVSACNLDVDRVSASAAMQVFQDGFLANRWSCTMGLATVPLAELYAPAIDRIVDSGGDIQLGVSAKAIAFDGRRVTGVVTDEAFVECSAVISAVPFDRLDKLVSDVLRRADKRLQKLDQFQTSPILGVHLRFNQKIMDLPHLVLVAPRNGVQWLFNKGVDDNGIQYLHAVISGADAWMDLDEGEIARRVMEDIHQALPRSIGLEPVDVRSIKEKRATFAPTPGMDAIRPSASASFASGGGVENLFLAGDWTDTGWPATMEGAVRSGYAVAAAVCDGRIPALVDDVPTGMLARLMGLR
jgi:squalene-associated FAD-dependent desaturase